MNGDVYKKVGGSWTLIGNIEGAVGPAGTPGIQGQYGGAITMYFLFNTSTSNADPGTGQFALNNATENSATAIYIDVTSQDAVSLATVLDNLTNSSNPNKAMLRIVNKNDVTKFLLFYITSETTHTGYREFAITIIASSAASPFGTNDPCLLCVDQIGDKGNTGAAGGAFTLVVNESGTSLANWTQVLGSWSVVSSAFQVTTPANTNDFLKYTAATAQSALVFQADMSLSSGGGYSGGSTAGLLFNWDGTSSIGGSGHGVWAALETTGQSPTTDGLLYIEQPSTLTAGPTLTFHFSFDTFYTLRIVAIGNVMDFFVNGTYQYTAYRQPFAAGGAAPAQVASFFGLRANNCKANFKNILLYTMVLP